jgi:phenylpropionate dioxygenase-like ring-hydroxylating dioxygenase large terminal subunit
VTTLDDDGNPLPEAQARLSPLRAKGKYSVVHLPNHWFILATSSELKDAPLARTLMGTPLVLFRDRNGAAGALLDRCPHRNVPLSGGRVAHDGHVECPYHGWRFDRGGACRAIPSYTGTPEGKARSCTAYPVIEQQGFVWVYSTPFLPGETAMPEKRPHVFERADDPRYVTVRQAIDMNGTMFSAIENALDVPHTAFLHKGLFRSESRGITLTVKVKRTHDRCEAEYVGEPRPPGFMARILSPSGGAEGSTVQHWDRFILPSIAQVEYRLGEENHVLADTAMTPISDFETRLWGVVSLKTRLPARVIEPFVKPIGLRVLQQDAEMLAKQTATVKHFGGEQFVWTEIDVLGKHIWRLMRAAERGEAMPEGETLELSLVV